MTAFTDNRSAMLPAGVVGLCLLIGLSLGGDFIGRGAMRFRSDARVVTVKGLVAREVKADQAVWKLGLRRASESLQDAHTRISADRDAPVAFLRQQGFAHEEIEREPTRTVDKLAREYGQPPANWGAIQIYGLDGHNESAPFSPTSTPVKRIRVVSTFEFELR